MARNAPPETPRPDGAAPWALLAQWQQQYWQAWPHVLSEAMAKVTDGAPSESPWHRQLEAMSAAMRQATLEQQALIASWQQLQVEFGEYWREQYAELMQRFGGTNSNP